MKRPLVLVALCYAAGLLAAARFQPPLTFLFPTAFVLLLAAIFRPSARLWLLWPLLFVTGWTNLATRTAIVSPHDLRRLVSEEAILATVRGRLLETPSLRIFQRDELESYRTIAEVEVSALNRGTNWQPATGRIMVTTPGSLPAHFFLGQHVEITGVLAVPPNPIADGLFDYRTFLRRQGIYFQFRASSTNDWQVVTSEQTTSARQEPRLTGMARQEPRPTGMTRQEPRPTDTDRQETQSIAPPFTDQFLGWAKRTLARGLPNEDESLRLMWAMTLGWKTALTGEVNEPFMQSGTMHIFAISGLHIALIAGILVALLRTCRVRRNWCGVVVIPLLWFYTAATGWQPSAIRSTVMMTVIIGGWSLRRPTDLLNSLAAAAFIILLWQPEQLFQASFQLSFFVVLSIALLMPPLEKFRDRAFQIDPMLPAELIPKWKRAVRWCLRWLATAFATSLAAWLGSLPLTAYYFHLFSPATLLANLVIVPLSTVALMCNLGSLICGDWLPWLTELFNHSGWLFMLWMTNVSRWVTEIPGAFLYVPAPSLVTMGIYYLLLVGALGGWLFRRQWRAWTITGLIIIASIYGWRWQAARSEVQLTVLPLGGGHGIFVDSDGRKDDWLIDCGGTNSVEFVMKPFLRAQGVNHIRRLLLTHGDLQHVGGTPLMENLFGVGEIYTSAVRFRSPAYRQIVAGLENTPDRHHIINRGDEAGAWRVLHPHAKDKFSQGDDSALVLLGEFYKTRVLLLSALGRPGQEALLERTNDLRADIVITGLPELTEPLCDALIEAIQPKLIIIADSEFPATKRAGPNLSERIGAHNIRVIYTRQAGAVTFIFRPAGWKIFFPEHEVVAPPWEHD